MQFLNEAKQKALEFAEANAAVLLTAGGVVGTVGTGVLAWRGGYKACEVISVLEYEHTVSLGSAELNNGPEEAPPSTWDKAKGLAPHAIPPILIGGATITSIIMGHKVSAQKAAALVAAYGLAERNFSEYKEKVAEKLTGPKKQQIDDELAQERVKNTPGSSQIIVMDGEVLCFDQPTGRYFRGSMEQIKRAVNALNAEIQQHGFADAQFFYDELELDKTTWTKAVGWGNTGDLVELEITTTQTPDGKPCLAIDFSRLPYPDYMQDYG